MQYQGESRYLYMQEEPKKMFKWNKLNVNINYKLILKLEELLG